MILCTFKTNKHKPLFIFSLPPSGRLELGRDSLSLLRGGGGGNRATNNTKITKIYKQKKLQVVKSKTLE